MIDKRDYFLVVRKYVTQMAALDKTHVGRAFFYEPELQDEGGRKMNTRDRNASAWPAMAKAIALWAFAFAAFVSVILYCERL